MQFNASVLEKIETLEFKLGQRDRENASLMEVNKKLKEKVVQFKNQNESNVKTAKSEIFVLNKVIKERQEEWE